MPHVGRLAQSIYSRRRARASNGLWRGSRQIHRCFFQQHQLGCGGTTCMNGGTRRIAVILACYFAEIFCAHAQGGPPMITDDPGTPGDGQWEIKVAYLEDHTAVASARGFPHIDLNYGLGDHIQLKYETGYLFVSGVNSDGVKRDVDDSPLGIKWRFLDQDEAGVDV